VISQAVLERDQATIKAAEQKVEENQRIIVETRKRLRDADLIPTPAKRPHLCDLINHPWRYVNYSRHSIDKMYCQFCPTNGFSTTAAHAKHIQTAHPGADEMHPYFYLEQVNATDLAFQTAATMLLTNQRQHLLSIAEITQFPISTLYRNQITSKYKSLSDSPSIVGSISSTQ
jgi:hypothetical protein